MGYVDNAKWKFNNTPVTETELNNLVAADKGHLKLLNPVTELPAAQKFTTIPDIKNYSQLYADSTGSDNAFWMTNEWVFEITNPGAVNYFDFTGDYIGDVTNKRIYKLSVYPYSPDGNVADKKPVLYVEYNKTKVKETISLADLPKGYYTMIIEDPVKIYRIKFSPPMHYSAVMRPRLPLTTPALYYSFLYVPEGTKYFNISRDGGLQLITPTGRMIKYDGTKNEIVQVQVQKGETGLWRIKLATGKLFIEGIPPFIGTSATQMLIPVQGK